MSIDSERPAHDAVHPTRRAFFGWAGSGLATAAFLERLRRDDPGPARLGAPHHVPRARRAIHVCLHGGMSHVDTFDPKPALDAHHGQSFAAERRPDTFFGQVGLLRRSDWSFARHGACGRPVSSLFPELAKVVDHLAFVHSMVAESSNHTPAIFQENTGFRFNGFPTLGAWLSHGLGSAAEDLPSYVVLPDVRGLPAGGTIHWTNGFLPARHQGVALRRTDPPVPYLDPPASIDPRTDHATRDLVAWLDARHARRHGSEERLLARARSYDLAARMQLAVPDVADLSREPAETRALYGLEREPTHAFGSACLLARRLVERGVRFVQLISGGSFGNPRINWDGHEDMVRNHGREAARIDRPVAALVTDLARRGLLEDTLVLFTTEFGRTPFAQAAGGKLGAGRDHDPHGFTVWLAGGGVRPGIAWGATDELGWEAVQDVVGWPDFHATVLHLLGIDHERLTFRHDGIERRLTNVHGRVVRSLLR